MIVLKFGGSSVADAACMRQVAGLVKAALPKAPLVVLSAMAKTTDGLFDAAKAAEAGDLTLAMELQRTLMASHRQAATDLFAGSVPEVLDEALTDLFGELELLLRGVALLRELSPRSMDAIASLWRAPVHPHLRGLSGGAWVDARTGAHRTDQVSAQRSPAGSLQGLAAEHWLPLLGAGGSWSPRATSAPRRVGSPPPWAGAAATIQRGPVRRGAGCRGHPDLDRCGGRAHLRPAHRARRPSHRRAEFCRGRGTGRLRRQGPAPRHHPAGGGGPHPGHRAPHPEPAGTVHDHYRPKSTPAVPSPPWPAGPR